MCVESRVLSTGVLFGLLEGLVIRISVMSDFLGGCCRSGILSHCCDLLDCDRFLILSCGFFSNVARPVLKKHCFNSYRYNLTMIYE